MTKETIDLILVVVQVATFIAVALYVRITLRMANSTKEMVSAAQKSAEASILSASAAENTVKELLETRDQETRPYIVVYFEVQQGGPFISLVIKNLGKTVAENVRLNFTPPLRSTTSGVEVHKIAAVTQGIGSMPPGHEIRTFFDSAISLFGDESAPLTYSVEVSYHGGLRTDARNYKLTLDLQAFRGLMYAHEKDLDDLVKQVEKLADNFSKTNEKLGDLVSGMRDGVWLRNQEFIIRNLDSGKDVWTGYAVAKLREFRSFWLAIKESKEFTPPSRIQSKCKFVAEQVSTIAASSPGGISEELTADLFDISAKLSELGGRPLYIGRESSEEFERAGDSLVERIDAVIKLLASKKGREIPESGNPENL
jgi:hypothetical protein